MHLYDMHLSGVDRQYIHANNRDNADNTNTHTHTHTRVNTVNTYKHA